MASNLPGDEQEIANANGGGIAMAVIEESFSGGEHCTMPGHCGDHFSAEALSDGGEAGGA